MTSQRRFFGSLFKKKVHSDTDIIDSLEKKYGISLSQTVESVEELLKRGYHRLGTEAKQRLLPVMQYIPGFSSGQAVKNGAKVAFAKATEGTYRPLPADGMHLMRSRTNPEHFRGIAMNDLTNARDIPEWVLNKAEFNVSAAPQVALSVFNAMSYLTGQYFMSEINKKLAAISSGVHEILQLLIDLQINDLQAYGDELQDISRRSQYYVYSSEALTAAFHQLHDIQHQSQVVINLAQSKIAGVSSSFTQKEKNEEITKKLESISGFIVHYHYALHIYNTATLLEMQISGTLNPDEMEAYRQQIVRRTEEYKEIYKETTKCLYEYLNKCSILNKRQFGDYLLSVGGAAFMAVFGGVAGRINSVSVGKMIDGLIMDKKHKLKEGQLAIVDQYVQELSDTASLDAPVQAIAQYIKATSNGIEIIHMNGEYYTNMPVQELQPQDTDHAQACEIATC